MKELKLSPLAEQDLLDVWQYIALDDEKQATRFLEELLEKINGLSDFPDLGVKRDMLCKDLFAYFYKRYSIYYTVKEDMIIVVRILHGSREVTNLF